MLSLLERFRVHATRARLFPAPGPAVVAVSGGPDSVALLELLGAVAPELGLALVVAHADHGIEPESGAVAAAVRRLAAERGLPFELGALGLGPRTSETVARRARYAWLRAVQHAHGARYLVTGHHRDDQIETVLLRVLRGSAPAGLAGIAARGRAGLVRPLLPFSKAELSAWGAERGLPVHQDPANADPRHLRSWIRTRLVPLLEARLGEDVGRHLERLGRHAAAERRAWGQALDLLPELELRLDRRGFDVARDPLTRYHDAIAVALVRAAAFRAGIPLGPTSARRLVAFARKPSGRRLGLRGDVTAETAFARLRVFRPRPGVAQVIVPAGERGRARFGDFVVSWAPEAAPAAGALGRAGWTTWVPGTEPGAGAPWEVRPVRPGDRLVPLGGVGHRPVRRLLMEAKVPRSGRAGYPVIACGETILWVPGICRGADALPEPGTRAVRLDVTEHGEPEADGRA